MGAGQQQILWWRGWTGPKRCVHILTPGTCEWDLIWKRVFVNVVKFRISNEIIPDHLIRDRRENTGREKTLWRRGRDQSNERGYKPRNAKDFWERGQAGRTRPATLWRSAALRTPRFQRLVSRTAREHISAVLSHPVSGKLLQQP